MTIDQATEPWMPNGFPPPSFVVEAERASALAGRGRWLAAAAILGALLLIAGILLIARSGDDGKTQLATDASTTTTQAEAAPVVPPVEGPQSAVTLPPGATTDSTALPVGPGAATTTVAAAPVPGAPPPPPPGVLEAPGGITLLTAFTNRPPVSDEVTLRNSGPTALNFGSEAGTGLTVSPASGSIGPGAAATVNVTFTPGNLPETRVGEAYIGRIVFNGSGGSRTMEVRTVVAKPPTITPTVPNGPYVQPVLSNKGPCDGGTWAIRAVVADQPAGVRDVTAFISERGAPPKGEPMVLEPRGTWALQRQPVTKEQALRIARIEAADNHGARAVVEPKELVCPA